MPRALTALAIALCVLSSSSPARADDLERARERFAEGVKRLEKGDYEGARKLFVEADQAHHSPVIEYNLALAEERLGHLQAAVDGYERYLTEAGDSGELGQAAAVAIAQIKGRAGRVRVESQPAGARVFINGSATRERTPTVVLVPAGHHVVVVEGDDYRASREIEVDAGATVPVEVARPEKPEDKGDPQRLVSPVTPAQSAGELHDLVWGGAFEVVPHGFFRRNQPGEEGATGVFVGLSASAGFAFTPRAVVGLRGFASVGSECKGVFDSHIAAAGPMLQLRVFDELWIGAGLYGGNGATCRTSETGPVKHFSTDIVFSPVFDLSYAVTSRHYGQWLVSAGVGYFFATPSNDNRLVYAPIGFGPRFF